MSAKKRRYSGLNVAWGYVEREKGEWASYKRENGKRKKGKCRYSGFNVAWGERERKWKGKGL